MFNLLRMDMYNLFKGTTFRVFMIIMAACVALSVAAMWFTGTQTYADLVASQAVTTESQSGVSVGFTDPTIEEATPSVEDMMTQTGAIGYGIGGNVLSFLIVLFVALLITGEFNSGFIKNTLTAQPSRTSYFISKAITIFVAALVLTLIAIILSLIGFAIAGLSFVASPVGEMVAWAALIVFLTTAMGFLVALISWLTRSKVAAVLAAVFVGTGLVVGIVQAVLSPFPALQKITDYTLYNNLGSIISGIHGIDATGVVHILVVGGVALIVYAFLSLVVVKKKDV